MSPQLEAEVARLALRRGDLGHAAHHIAGILAADPLDRGHIALFGQLAEAADEGLVDLFEMSEGVWFGIVACRARALAQRGDHSEALSLLCQVAAVMPTVPYLAWARAWPLPPRTQAFARLRPLLELDHEDTWKLALSTVVDRALAAYPEEPQLAWLGSIGARRSGALERAVTLAQHSVSVGPTWMGFVALANAHRALDRWDDTVAAWQQALDVDPSDASVLLDWGDSLLERGLRAEARERYQQALKREPDQPWAEASVRYLDWYAAPSTPKWLELMAWLRAQDRSPRARWAMGQATPWRGYLPDPMEATAGLLDKMEDSTPTTVQISHLEGPSVLWAVASGWPSATVQAEVVPEPDPREPLIEVRHTLWRWRDLSPVPALEAPDFSVSDAVRALAVSPYEASRWLAHATRIAHELGPTAPTDLLATALHPPEAPDGMALHHWLWRVQHAVAFVLAAYPGWEGEHHDALWSMVAVRNDWLATAALAASVARAEEDDHVCEDVLKMALTILRSPPDAGAFCTAWPAWYAVLRLDPEDELGLHERAVRFLDED